jgi:hypothetical protein
MTKNAMKFSLIALGTASISCLCAPALAATIVSNTSGGNLLGGSGYEGHSFTTPADNSYNTLSFSWLSPGGTTPLAAGNLFLLTNEYLSSPANLSASTPGFVAQSTGIVNNAYIFNPSVTINPLTQYWVYMGGVSALAGGGFGGNTLPGGQAYEQFGSSTGNYFSSGGGSLDFNFTLSGNVAAAPSTSVPEPFTIIGTIIGGTAAFRMRKKLKSTAD